MHDFAFGILLCHTVSIFYFLIVSSVSFDANLPMMPLFNVDIMQWLSWLLCAVDGILVYVTFMLLSVLVKFRDHKAFTKLG